MGDEVSTYTWSVRIKVCADKWRRLEQIERIECAAIRTTDGVIHSAPQPGRHGDVFALVRKSSSSHIGAQQGFLTNTGRFVDRAEAFAIAKAANQLLPYVSRNVPILFSEDVW